MINNYDRHRFSEMTRQYSTDDLVASIKQEGQLVPAILWNDGEKLVLVDGYHRQKACQELGIGLKVTELPEGTEEHQIPKKILDIQLMNKIAGKIQANCEAVIYLDMVKDFNPNQKMKKTEMYKTYLLLNEKAMQRLGEIRKLMPDWFNILRAGNKVDISITTTPHPSDSPYSVLLAARALVVEKEKDGSMDECLDTTSMITMDDAEFREKLIGFKQAVSKVKANWKKTTDRDVLKQYHLDEIQEINAEIAVEENNDEV